MLLCHMRRIYGRSPPPTNKTSMPFNSYQPIGDLITSLSVHQKTNVLVPIATKCYCLNKFAIKYQVNSYIIVASSSLANGLQTVDSSFLHTYFHK
jgi:hypothetical protein